LPYIYKNHCITPKGGTRKNGWYKVPKVLIYIRIPKKLIKYIQKQTIQIKFKILLHKIYTYPRECHSIIVDQSFTCLLS
jgi:hypothetical protein